MGRLGGKLVAHLPPVTDQVKRQAGDAVQLNLIVALSSESCDELELSRYAIQSVAKAVDL